MKNLDNIIESKIKFTPESMIFLRGKYRPIGKKYQRKVIKRIKNLANKSYATDLFYKKAFDLETAYLELSISWKIIYKTKDGNLSKKTYMCPVEVISPFKSDFIKEVEIVSAGSG